MELLKEEQTGALRKRLVAEDGLLLTEYLADTGRAKAALSFIIDRDTPETRAGAMARPIRGLSAGARSGLAALLRRSAEPDEPGAVAADGEVGGMVGNCDTLLTVDGGRLVYTVEPRCAGCGGSARLDLGAATEGRVKKMRQACERFQDQWLEPYVWAVKHEYIDNGGFEDREFGDDE